MAVAIAQAANVAGGASVSSVVTYTAASIGTASTDRIVVVCAVSVSASLPQSATIGGVTMSKTTNGNFASNSSILFYLPVATGTTANIAVTYNGTVAANASAIVVYAVTGATPTPSVIGGGNGSTDCDATAPLTTGAITIPTSGGFIGAASVASNSSTTTWANATVDVNAAHIGFTYTTSTRITALAATAVTMTGSVNLSDGALGWLVFNPGTWLTPTVGSVTLTGATPNVLPGLQPTAASLALSSDVPDFGFSDTWLRPDGTLAAGAWTTEAGGTTNLNLSVDEVTPSDSDYIISSIMPAADTVLLSLSDPASGITGPIYLRYRIASGAYASPLQVRLMQGATQVALWTHTGLTTSFATFQQKLTSDQIAAITDPTDLRVEFDANP